MTQYVYEHHVRMLSNTEIQKQDDGCLEEAKENTTKYFNNMLFKFKSQRSGYFLDNELSTAQFQANIKTKVLFSEEMHSGRKWILLKSLLNKQA